jgi:NSS family neurotransmitter:Na+ symporter
VLIPLLFVLLAVAALRALTLPGAENGLERMFRPNFHLLLDHRVWLEAFSQSAWSTGAGWGLLLVYGSYARRREDVVLNAAITGLGNNAASLLAGFAVLPTVFALLPADQAEQVTAAGNEGLAFIWMPRLFLSGGFPGGRLLLVVFFTALSVAALSSLIAMIELGIRTLMDFDIKRRTAALIVAGAGLCLGLSSALSLSFFENQDWVWGLGLLLSGALFALGTAVHGIRRLRAAVNSERPGIALGRWFDWLVLGFIPAAFLSMLAWWFYQSIQWEPGRWHDPFATFSLGTCLFQWAVALCALALLGGWMARKVSRAGKELEP